MTAWPRTPEELRAEQEWLGRVAPRPWTPAEATPTVGGCFVCFPRGGEGAGEAGDAAWAAATVTRGGRAIATAVVGGHAAGPYAAGLLALREGLPLEAAVRALAAPPDVLLVNATGRDHPRRAGLALHLGAVLDLPTVGVTNRLLLAAGDWPAPETGARSPIRVHGETVGYWLRTRAGARPLAIHAGWRVAPEQALEVVQGAIGGARTPEPLRQARRLARLARARDAVGPAG
jgi:deoxyribonuclease V